MSKKKLDLHFGRTDKKEGFTSAGLQPYNDLNPTAIVRELIQNSLDAVSEAGRKKTIIRFEIGEMAMANVPAIAKYRDVFNKAKKSGHDISDGQASAIVESIEKCLGKDKIEVLSVMDNGIGLNEGRMDDLLADGSSSKSSTSSGSVGNGHMTAIPASDLRYILYGGVCEGGKKIASGHAIIASFLENDKHKGMDGYYILDFKNITNYSKGLYEYPVQDQISSLIKKKLDWIEKKFESKTGTVVIIPGFNRFREGEIDLWSVIKKASACNFFVAIAEGYLEVIYQDSEGEKKLDEISIKTLFESDISSEKRAKNFIAGNHAVEAYNTAIMGKKDVVDVGCGKVEVIIREVKEGISRINLCRNGMWITDDLKHGLNRYKFNDRKSFNCLIKVTAEDGDIHRLIRKSEGPLHNNIEAQKWLSGEDLLRLKSAFAKISNFLSTRLEKLQDKEFTIDDILSINDGRFKEWERLRPPSSRVPSGDERGGTGGGDGGGGNGNGDSDGGSNSFKRSGNSILFGAIPVPTSARSYNVELYPQEELKGNAEAEIRFLLDENIDETCDPTNDEQYVGLKSIKMNKKEVSDENLIRNDSNIVQGIRLGQFKLGEKYTISFDYDLPDDIAVGKDDKIVLRAEIVRRRSRA